MKPRKPLKRSTKPIAKKSAKKLAHEFAMQGLSDMAFIAHITRNQTPIPKKRDKPRRKANPLDAIFPNENEVKKEPVVVRVFKDGREACNMLTTAGRDEYQRRRRIVWERQTFQSIGIDRSGHYCGICKEVLFFKDATTDHIRPRKMGSSERDDRVENLSAVHWACNAERGSKRKGYYGVP